MKIKLRVCAAVLMAVVLAGSCLAQKPVTDDAITTQVQIKLAADGGRISVETQDGVVTLSGVVDSQRIKLKAAKLAQKVKGVKQIVNNITVRK